MLTTLAIIVAVALVAVAIGGLLGYRWRLREDQRRLSQAGVEANRILQEARERTKETVLEAKEEALKLRQQAENEVRERRRELGRQEQRLSQKDEGLERKVEAVERRERSQAEREKALERRQSEMEELKRQRLEEIQRVAGLTTGEAKNLVLASVEEEVREEANRRARRIQEDTRREAEEKARHVIVDAMQRVGTEAVAETTSTVVPIPSDDMKGRIIGREGRNIRALEAATGVDLIIDDTPDAVTLSCFDSVRREIARLALQKLLIDGRIHPARIEEMVEKAKREVEQEILKAGDQAALEAGCPGLHPDVIKVLGRLKYRTSYGQNQLKHAVETAHIATMMAHEVGANVDVCRRGALLHDLGKALDHEVEGTHAQIGAQLLRRYGVSPAVVHCVAAHHEEEEPATVESVLVLLADALSGSRPGARRESLDQYIRRLEALEHVAQGFDGVEKAFAIQAGREVRVIVKPEQIDDLGAMRLARDVSKKIEETLEYPGQVKVTVEREVRAVEYAK